MKKSMLILFVMVSVISVSAFEAGRSFAPQKEGCGCGGPDKGK